MSEVSDWRQSLYNHRIPHDWDKRLKARGYTNLSSCKVMHRGKSGESQVSDIDASQPTTSKVLSDMPGLDTLTGDNEVTLDFDFKHIFKRICTLIRSPAGITLNNGRIINAMMLSRGNLVSNDTAMHVDGTGWTSQPSRFLWRSACIEDCVVPKSENEHSSSPAYPAIARVMTSNG
ncbi:uncharacterized protein F5147DRAFT_654045 [Suillus discolor]|uniref:Uncharacterized protein n=1 Tax=Suillus discolor TaxID=1912936 RepID=A0A9P7JSC4_9AGAM|nr:uncharacterized protein F5147DRAFT_654045 [Suillus discolor]KAG2105797.1 hypothetical protein F5147DRAFT_654045 [Suillus discolor]